MKIAPAASSTLVPVVLAMVIFSGLSIAAAITSEGFLEADACTHYMYARAAFAQPHFFVDIWGRPVCTAIYSLPAALGGRLAVRMTSLLLALGCGLVAMRIAWHQGYRLPALALIFTLAQPLVFLHSFSEMTELPFAFLLGLGFLMFQTGRWMWVAILIGLTPLSRPEGFGLVILAGAALLIYRRWWWLPLLVLPVVFWSLSGWIMFGRTGAWWRWLIDNWPYSAQSTYAAGPIFHFLKLLPVVSSPLILPAMGVGIWRSLARAKTQGKGNEADHSAVCPHRGVVDALIALIPLMILLGHSILFAAGKMASSGEIRYLLIAAPFWGLLSARGWEWVFIRMNWQGPLRMAGVAALLPVLANQAYRVVPLKLQDDWISARQIVQWYAHSTVADHFPRMAAAHEAIYYFMGIVSTDPRALEWRSDLLVHPSPGTIVVWDPLYSIYNSDRRRQVPLEDLRVSGWIDVTDHVSVAPPNWHVLISPIDSSGQDGREILRSLSRP